jgi:hypothetical protein
LPGQINICGQDARVAGVQTGQRCRDKSTSAGETPALPGMQTGQRCREMKEKHSRGKKANNE